MADAFRVSESQAMNWERAGLLHPIDLANIPGVGIRAKRFDPAEVHALARRILAAAEGGQR